MRSKNRGLLIFFSVLLVLFSAYFFTKVYEAKPIKKILKNAGFSSGQFTGDVEPYKKGSNGPWYICYYEVNGKVFTTSEPVNMCKKLGKEFFNQRFPVIYDSLNPGSSRVLVFPFEFEEFNLKFPDSLNWVINRIQ